ncbi:MAG: hypothetical protein V1889_02755 [archaeon]
MFNGELKDYVAVACPARWVLDMREFYEEHVYYRLKDLNRLLGDFMQGVVGNESGARERLLERFL